MVSAMLEGLRLAFVDDDKSDADTYARRYSRKGMITKKFTQFDPAQSADEFLDMLMGEEFDALVCDLVLQSTQPVGFNGAELVSKANLRPGRKLPSLLISSHEGTDETWPIRYWREGIPCVLQKRDVWDHGIEALEAAILEASGKVSRERRAFATPVRVLEVFPDGHAPTAKVIVSGWDSAEVVSMPLRLITDAIDIPVAELAGRWLEAEVNCYAEHWSELFYRNISLAPELPEGWIAD